MQLILVFLIICVTLCTGQFYYHQQAGLKLGSYQQPQYAQYQQSAPAQASQQYAHPSVIANSVYESQLPPELSKSARFYNNPRIAAGLAKESWFTDKEMPVLDREAEKIPREMVYKIFKNAGYIKRR